VCVAKGEISAAGSSAGGWVVSKQEVVSPNSAKATVTIRAFMLPMITRFGRIANLLWSPYVQPDITTLLLANPKGLDVQFQWSVQSTPSRFEEQELRNVDLHTIILYIDSMGISLFTSSAAKLLFSSDSDGNMRSPLTRA